MATAARRIGVKPVIWRRGDHGVVAVDVDITADRPAPGEVYRMPPLHLVAARSKRDLSGCCCGRRSWAWSYSCRRSRGRCRRWRWRCSACRLSVVEGILLGTAADRDTPIHPRAQVLVWRRVAVVVVAGIGRLDARIRLGRQWTNYI
jgi:hypothetical protein